MIVSKQFKMDKIESKQFEIEQKNVLGDMCEIDTGTK